MAKRGLRWGMLGSLAAMVCYFILLIGNPNDLKGQFSSYDLFPHNKRDVLEFDNGLVTLKTCCGNSYCGEYMRKDNSWVWEHQTIWRQNPPEFQFKTPLKIVVVPHLFSITIRFEDGKTLKLPRRAFKSIPL